MTKEELKKAIQERVFVRHSAAQPVVGAQGVPERWIFDFRALMLQPEALDSYAELFWQAHEAQYPFQVCAMESAGISLVAAIVMKGLEKKRSVNGLFIRKSRKRQGLMKQIEGTPNEHSVILVDDLINSGSTFQKQIEVLSKNNLRIASIFALLRYRDLSAYEFATSAGISVSSLFSLEDFGLPLRSKDAPEVPKDAFDIVWTWSGGLPAHHNVVQKSSPVLDNELLYMGTDDGRMVALQQKDGSLVWEFGIEKHPFGKGIFSSPVLHEGVLYFGAYDGHVYALDAETGQEKWRFSDADWIGSSPALALKLNLLFIGLEFGLFNKRGGIAALDMKTGALKWKHSTSHLTHGSPLFVREHNLVVIGSNDGVLYAHDAKTGEVAWTFTTKGDIKTFPAYDSVRDYIISASMDGNVYVLSARDGNPVLVCPTGAGIYSTPYVVGDVVYVSSLDKSLYAFDLNTGKTLWSFETSGRVFASPRLIEGSLWIGSNDGRLYEIDPENGKRKSFLQLSERIVNPIAYNEKSRLFFVPTCANEVYGVRRKGSGDR